MTASALPLFYSRPKVLQPAAHGQRSLAAGPDYRFAANTNAVPLGASEMPVACRHFPIVFATDPQPHPVAVLGLRGQQNLFVDAAGRWRAGSYVPAYIRRYPFIFLENEARNELTLCVDEAAPTLIEGRSNPLFDEAGEPTALTRSALAFCRDYQGQHVLAAAFGQAMADAGMLVDHRAEVTLNDGQRLSLSGFKVIDEARFNKLSQKEFQRWRTKGWLPLVYCHFISIGTWSALVDQMVESRAPAEG